MLRMFGIPILEETRVLCDNKSTVKTSSLLESILHKKNISIAYCDVQWAVAAGIMVVVWIENIVNITDTFTKSLSDMHRDKLFRYWTYEYLFIYCISKIEGTKNI